MITWTNHVYSWTSHLSCCNLLWNHKLWVGMIIVVIDLHTVLILFSDFLMTPFLRHFWPSILSCCLLMIQFWLVVARLILCFYHCIQSIFINWLCQCHPVLFDLHEEQECQLIIIVDLVVKTYLPVYLPDRNYFIVWNHGKYFSIALVIHVDTIYPYLNLYGSKNGIGSFWTTDTFSNQEGLKRKPRKKVKANHTIC